MRELNTGISDPQDERIRSVRWKLGLDDAVPLCRFGIGRSSVTVPAHLADEEDMEQCIMQAFPRAEVLGTSPHDGDWHNGSDVTFDKRITAAELRTWRETQAESATPKR